MGLFAPMKPAVDERGFSLIEAFCLLAFAVILLLITTQTGSRPSSRAKLIAVEIQMKNLNQALGDFRKDNGFYPTGSNGLQFLVRQPAGTTNWQGPYLEGSIPKDPWGHDYCYEYLASTRPRLIHTTCFRLGRQEKATRS